ncbi:MAG: MTH1187 family thiamine-binding protein [Phycisphaerae bacterium]
MNVIVDLCVVPVGVGVSVSRYVAACQRVLSDAGFTPHLHAYGTTIEGDWDAVFAAVKRCHQAVHDLGAPRISTTIKLGTRTDRKQSIEQKVRSVHEKLASP